MDGSRFDLLAATFAAGPSRRRLLGALLGAAYTSLLTRPERAAGKKKKKCPKLRPRRCGDKCCKAFETCKRGKCVDHCDDKKENLGETDIDCGGGDCAPCPTGKKCKRPDDCKSGICRTSSTSATLRCRECTRDEDCTADFTKPFCVNDRCVECRTSTDCQNTGRPHCLTGASPTLDGACVVCLNDSHCPAGELCNPLTNRCDPCARTRGVGIESCAICQQDSDCPGEQVCDGQGRCVDCFEDAHCDSDPNRTVCVENVCKECGQDGDCPNGGDICIQGFCRTPATCPAGSDLCTQGFVASTLCGGGCRCHTTTESETRCVLAVESRCDSQPACTSRAECEARHGPGAFCVRDTGNICGCAHCARQCS